MTRIKSYGSADVNYIVRERASAEQKLSRAHQQRFPDYEYERNEFCVD